MDKRVSFRFYEVKRHQRSRLTFADALAEIGNIPHQTARERQLGQDFYVRAEQINSARGSVAGEMTRIQKTNFPSEIAGDNRIPLQTRNPLGHSVVFRYLPATSHLGIQYDPRLISPGRFMDYVSTMIEGAFFELDPIVRADMWDQFRQAPVRRFAITVARPSQIAAVERGAAAAVATSMRNMAEAYELPKITIEMSMGNRRGALGERVKAVAEFFRVRAVREEIEVTSMQAKIKNEGEKAEELNLLDDILVVKKDLELTERDPDANYNIRVAALRDSMNDWIQ